MAKESRHGAQSGQEMESKSFFESATMGTFYTVDVPNPRKLELTPEQTDRWFRHTPKDVDAKAERIAYARSQGIPWIDDLNASRDSIHGSYYLREVPAPHLTYWFPHHLERQFIFSLARSLAGSGERPTILEAACGSGIISRLLAAENTAKVIGVDPDMVGMGSTRIPATPGDVEVMTSNLWDVLSEFGPTYSHAIQARRDKLLQIVKDETTKKPVFELIRHGNLAVNYGESSRLNEELVELQDLSSQFEQPSPVDIVLCSFMPDGIDLTVPIRDGVHPKAIIYVRPRPPFGFSGAGDFYYQSAIDEENGEKFSEFTPDMAVSFNAGRDYRTIVKWTTHSANGWGYYHKPPRFHHDFATEVVVQLRKDIALRDPGLVVANKYPFDEEFARSFESEGDFINFEEDVTSALSMFST